MKNILFHYADMLQRFIVLYVTYLNQLIQEDDSLNLEL